MAKARCYEIDVDGETIRARLDGEPSEATLNALRDVVRAARRRMAEEHPHVTTEPKE